MSTGTLNVKPAEVKMRTRSIRVGDDRHTIGSETWWKQKSRLSRSNNRTTLKDEEHYLEHLRHALAEMHAEVGQHVVSPTAGCNLEHDLEDAAEP